MFGVGRSTRCNTKQPAFNEGHTAVLNGHKMYCIPFPTQPHVLRGEDSSAEGFRARATRGEGSCRQGSCREGGVECSSRFVVSWACLMAMSMMHRPDSPPAPSLVCPSNPRPSTSQIQHTTCCHLSVVLCPLLPHHHPWLSLQYAVIFRGLVLPSEVTSGYSCVFWQGVGPYGVPPCVHSRSGVNGRLLTTPYPQVKWGRGHWVH